MQKTWIFSCSIVLSVLWCLPMHGQQLSSYAKNSVIRVKLDPTVAEQLGNTPKTRGGGVSTGIQPFDTVNKQIKTNADPILEISKESLALSMDVTKSYKASDSLIISNTGEGMLKWSISMNGSKNSVSPQSVNPIGQKENNLKTSAYRGSPHITAATPLEVIESGVKMDEYPRFITYNQGIHFHIGESDTA